MSGELRIIASSVFLSVLLAPNWLCIDSLGPWLGQPLCQLQLQLFGLQTGCGLEHTSTAFNSKPMQHACNSEDGAFASGQHSSWHSFVLLRGLAVLLLFSTTAHITRNTASRKLLLHLSDRLSLFLRVTVQLAICADLLSSRWACTAVRAATQCPAAAAGHISAHQHHLSTLYASVNHTMGPATAATALVAASPAAACAALHPALAAAAAPSPSGAAKKTRSGVKPSEAARAASPAAAVDVLPDPALPPAPGWRVSKLQYRPQHIIAGTFLLNHLAFFSHNLHSEVLAGILELMPLCANSWLLPIAAPSSSSSSSSSSGRSLLRLLLLAVVSRVLLPLLVGHMQLRRHAVQQQQHQQQQVVE